MAHGLTPKQFLFCEYYIQTLNGTLAAKLAGYKGKNDSVFAVTAHDNLRKPKIKAFLSERYKEVAMDTDEVLMRLAKIARTSQSEFVNEYGGIDWEKANKEGYAIKAVTHTVGKQSKLGFEDKLRALELIGKSQAIFTDKIELVNWREEMAKAGIPASEIFEEYVRQFMKAQVDNPD